jgi:hypothetical protein
VFAWVDILADKGWLPRRALGKKKNSPDTGQKYIEWGKEEFYIFIFIEVYRPIISCGVLHGFETCPGTIRKQHRLRAMKKRMLRKTFGLERNNEKGEWRRLRDEKL